MLRSVPTRARAATGMSLVEVMLAMLVLSVGMMTAIGQISALQGARKQTAEDVQVEALLSSIAERFQGARWEVLDTNDAPWSRHRIESGTGVTSTTAPLAPDEEVVDASERASRGLVATGLLAEPCKIRGLRIYVEYYRSMRGLTATGAFDSSKPGLSDGETETYASSRDFEERFRFSQPKAVIDTLSDASAVYARRNSYRLIGGTQAATSLVDEGHPVAIRLLATWNNRHMSILTARRP